MENGWNGAGACGGVCGAATSGRGFRFTARCNHIYAQVVSDDSGQTLAAASTLTAELREGLKSRRNVQAAKVVGKSIAERCLSKGISQVIFDRNGFLYHGRVKALADAAREAGLKF